MADDDPGAFPVDPKFEAFTEGTELKLRCKKCHEVMDSIAAAEHQCP